MAALCYALLSGSAVSIKTGFEKFGITNIPREISRSVEKKFGVKVERTKKDYITKYGIATFYYEYRLIRGNNPKEAIDKMYEYVQENMIPQEPSSSNYIHPNLF